MVARAVSRTPSPSAKRIKLDPSTLNQGCCSSNVASTSTLAPAVAMESALNGVGKSAEPSIEELVEEEMSKPIEHVREYEHEVDYESKLVLAPMVRSGTLPMRLLALYYGAGLVWSPEVVDKAIIGATRTVDPVTGVISYSKKDGRALFTCHPVEKPYLIFQIGSSDPELAVQAAKVVQQDVAGVDLNCGCPKPFSTHSGMGAALLSTPDILLSILRALVSSIPLPISCKIRLLPEQPSTLHLASRILRTGVRNLTVHCRTRDMRSSQTALWDRLSDIVELGRRRRLPVICNGDGEGWSNWQKIRDRTGVTSVMIARAAEANPSIFLPTGPLSTCEKVIPDHFLPVATYIQNHYSNTRFLLAQFKASPAPISEASKDAKKRWSDGVSKAKTEDDALRLWNLDEEETVRRGREFMKELTEKMDAREGRTILPNGVAAAGEAVVAQGNIWEEREVAERDHTAVDQPEGSLKDPKLQEAMDDEEATMNDL